MLPVLEENQSSWEQTKLALIASKDRYPIDSFLIGVNPSFYEYLFMVDADTTVNPLSVNRLISAYIFFLDLLLFI